MSNKIKNTTSSKHKINFFIKFKTSQYEGGSLSIGIQQQIQWVLTEKYCFASLPHNPCSKVGKKTYLSEKLYIDESELVVW